MNVKTNRLHFYPLAPSAQDDHEHSFQLKPLPEVEKNEKREPCKIIMNLYV